MIYAAPRLSRPVALRRGLPSGMREPRRHANAGGWQHWSGGHGRITVLASDGKARTEDLASGDAGYVERSKSRCIENTGAGMLEFLEIFEADTYMDVCCSDG